MIKQIKFEDNIFILMTRIRMIRDIITLDAAPELFLEKTLDDIYFADHTLDLLLECLKENSRLIEREELLEQLIELEWQFSRVLRELADHEGSIYIRETPSIMEKVAACENNSRERRKTAEDMCRSSGSAAGEPVVSSDELTELLKAF